MGLYKPQSQFMAPNNETIDAGVMNTFTSRVSGDYCRGYIWNIKNSQTSLEGADIGLNQITLLSSPLYNNDELSITVPANWFNGATVSGNLNHPLAWNIIMLGKNRSITANTTIERSYETEDPVKLEQITALQNENQQIKNQIADIQAKSTEQVTALEIEILKVKADPTLTEEQKTEKIKEIQSQIDLLEANTKILINEKQNQIKANESEIETLKNNLIITKTYTETVITINNPVFKTGDSVYLDYVAPPVGENPTPDPTSLHFYYIRVDDNDTCKLYDTREKAIGLDAVAEEYKAISFPDGVLVGKNICSYSKSDDIRFRVINSGTFVLDSYEINKFFNVFIPSYTQENDIPINNFQATLYDSDGNIITQSEIIYSSNVQYYFDGLLTGNCLVGSDPTPRLYMVQFTAYNDVNYFYDTGKVNFYVKYETADLDTPLFVTNNCKDSTITIDWQYLVSIPGFVDCYDFVNNFMWDGNKGLYICPNNTLKYQFPNIQTAPINGELTGSLPIFVWQPKSLDWTGEIYRNYYDKDTEQYTSVGYDGEAITLTINGQTIRTQWFNIEQDVATGEEFVYLVAVWKHSTAVHKFLKSKLPPEPVVKAVNVVNITSRSATIIVDAQSDFGILSYKYYLNGNVVGTSLDNTFYLPLLLANTEYNVQVEVTGKNGEISISDKVYFTTTYGAPIITSVTVGSLSQTAASVTINAESILNIIDYTITYGNDNVGWKSQSSLVPTLSLTGLNRNEVYTVKCTATNEILEVSDIYTDSFSLVDDPLNISNVAISGVDESSVKVTATFFTTAGLKTIYYRIDNNLINIGTQNPYTLTGLQSNTTHRLNVIIEDNKGNRVTSPTLRFRTLAYPPVINSVTVTAVTNTTATIKVDATAEANIDRYEVINNG